jgi:hypothetical protein
MSTHKRRRKIRTSDLYFIRHDSNRLNYLLRTIRRFNYSMIKAQETSVILSPFGIALNLFKIAFEK